MAELTLDNVTKIFHDSDEGEIVAVDDVSLTIPDGDFLVLVGPSGCGKSTTLRMIAGLEEPTEGEISLDDRVINDISAQNRDIAMVFQSYALYPHMTVRENMSFGLEESTDMSDAEIDDRVKRATDMMGITDLLDRKPDELSGGQQQRVALGRAIVRDPEIFLMDEPLSNLDAKLRAEMRTELQHLQDELGVTTMYVTHDQTEAMTMGDHIAILNDGRLQQVGAPLECYHEPNNLFVADFLGEPSMNFFEVTREDDALVGDGFEIPISDEIEDDIGETTELVLGIRPEDIRLAEDEGPTTYPATVDVVEPHGNENVTHLTFRGQTVSEETLFTATTGGRSTLGSGDNTTVTFPPETIHLFDANSGEALHNRDVSTVEVAKIR